MLLKIVPTCKQTESNFGALIDYVLEKNHGVFGSARLTHGVTGIGHASAEMSVAAARNPSVTDPVVHAIVSCPETEHHDDAVIFSVAKTVLFSLGINDH